LSEVVTGMHGSDRQPGEEDLRTQILQRKRKLLEEELRSALACEDYALAGQVRDLLRAEGEAS
jgi:protein-arginine kinase activator protein McsA